MAEATVETATVETATMERETVEEMAAADTLFPNRTHLTVHILQKEAIMEMVTEAMAMVMSNITTEVRVEEMEGREAAGEVETVETAMAMELLTPIYHPVPTLPQEVMTEMTTEETEEQEGTEETKTAVKTMAHTNRQAPTFTEEVMEEMATVT